MGGVSRREIVGVWGGARCFRFGFGHEIAFSSGAKQLGQSHLSAFPI